MEEETHTVLRFLRGLQRFVCSRTFLSLLVGVILILAMHTTGKVIRPNLLKLSLWLLPTIFLVFLATRSAPDLSWFIRPSLSKAGMILISLGILALFGSYTDQFWFYFLHWKTPLKETSAFTVTGLFQFVLLTALLTPFLIHRLRWKPILFLLLLLGSQILCANSFLDETGGRTLFRDDHSSFIYRLWEVGQTFPQLINYDPHWNGGLISHYPTSSGTVALALPLFPLISTVPIFNIYSYVILILYVGAEEQQEEQDGFPS